MDAPPGGVDEVDDEGGDGEDEDQAHLEHSVNTYHRILSSSFFSCQDYLSLLVKTALLGRKGI